MNPGNIVAGGGGAGGGSGGEGSKDGGGGNGENGNGDQADAEADQRNVADGTGKCDGSGGCQNPGHGNKGSASAGDPIDIATGRVYTLPEVDLALPGHLPLIIVRQYNSLASNRDVGLGFGWSHSLAWELERTRRGARLWTPQGTHWTLDLPKPGETVRLNSAQVEASRDGYVVFNQEDGNNYVFETTGTGRKRLNLVRIRDRYGHEICLDYDGGDLASVTDTVGRTILVRRTSGGQISAFELQGQLESGERWRFREYEYDDQNDLVSVRDAEGCAKTFRYEQHLMTLSVTARGHAVHHRYDRRKRCVESWCAPVAGDDPALSSTAPAVLADNVTPAKGIHHVKLDFIDDETTMVVDSRMERLYHHNAAGKITGMSWGSGTHSNEFDAHGEVAKYTDAHGATWSWERDADGRVVRTVDPLGHETTTRYNEQGDVVSVTHEDGVEIEYDRDRNGDPLSAWDADGQLIANTFDVHGQLLQTLLPNGAVTAMGYDAMANRTSVQEPNGGQRVIQHDYLGRVLSMVDEGGYLTRYAYTARGELAVTQMPDQTQLLYSYDADGNLERFTTPEGQTFELHYSGLGLVHEVRRPDGHSIRFRYDREAALVEVFNEKGEVHSIKRSLAGHIAEEETFDGRRVIYGVDAQGQLTSIEGAPGETTQIEYDALGRIAARTYSDGTEDRFTYDPIGRLLSTDNGEVSCRFEYDRRGNLIRDIQSCGGTTTEIASRFDAMGNLIERSSDRGHTEAFKYNLMGELLEHQLGGNAPTRFYRDLLGRESARELPGGGRLQFERNSMGLPTRRCLMGPAHGAHRRPDGEPDWVGGAPSAGIAEQSYHWGAGETLDSMVDSAQGATQYRYDPTGQLTARIPAHARQELFSYRPDGELHDDQFQRKYVAGGRLVERGDTEFEYDHANRMISRRRRSGEESATWRYEWNGRGLLQAAVSPAGERIEHVYDSMARRIEKRVVDHQGQELNRIRFVWDGDQLIHELREQAAASDDPIVEEWTYAYAPGSISPLAHCVQSPPLSSSMDRAKSTTPWVYYVEGFAGRPDFLVEGDGSITARLDGRTFGQVQSSDLGSASTPHRFAGHYEDEESGLFFNRYRFYDPELGRYLSPEPLGLMGGLQAFTYAGNDPLRVVDLDGLAGMIATASGMGESATRGSASTKTATIKEGTRGKQMEKKLHPVVQAALQYGGEEARNGDRHPASCAEPRAISDYLDATVGRDVDLSSEEGKSQVRKALQEMSVEASVAEGKYEGKKRAPCANCSQLLANLQQSWGGPKTSNIAKGSTTSQGNSSQNFTPPKNGAGKHSSYPLGD